MDDTGVLGKVSDSSGGVIPGASVTVKNVATGVEQNVITGSDGAFEVRYLSPGAHIAVVSLTGFRTERRTFTLRVAQMIRLDVSLQVGDLTESVEVVATGPIDPNSIRYPALGRHPVKGRSLLGPPKRVRPPNEGTTREAGRDRGPPGGLFCSPQMLADSRPTDSAFSGVRMERRRR